MVSQSEDSSTSRTQGTRSPLPKMQMSIVLSMLLAEPITATVIFPFIYQLVRDTGITGGRDIATGYYVGIIDSLFFVTQGIFVFQWGWLSDRIGRRIVLFIGLLGLTVSMLGFGLSKTFAGLVVSRMLVGVLNGNAGVMKSMLVEITDETNQAKAIGFIPATWGIGMCLGPVLGGTLEHPANKYPAFSHPLWKEYPYFLPCLVAACFSLVSLLLGVVFLEESLASKKKPKPTSALLASEVSPLLPSQVDVETENSRHIPLKPPSAQRSIRSLITKPVLIAILNYGWLAFLDISYLALLPVFLASPVEMGGTNLPPQTIGIIIGVYGILNGLVQVAFFNLAHKWLGAKRLFMVALTMFWVIYGLYPVIHFSVISTGSMNVFSWIALTFLLIAAILMDMAYGCTFIFTNCAVSGPDVLGATNGISQTIVSFLRALGPVGATALFSFSIDKHVLSGNFIYVVFSLLTGLALYTASFLPSSEKRYQGALPNDISDV